LISISKYLQKRDHKALLITKYDVKEVPIENIYDTNNIYEIEHTNVRNFSNIHLTLQTLSLIFELRNKVDILHLQQTYMLSAFSAMFGKLLGLPVVTTAHLKVVESSNPIKRLVNSFFVYTTINLSDEVIYVSEATKNSFKSSKGIAIRNGIDTERFIENKKIRYEMRRRLHLEDQFVLLFASRWAENKGIFNLLKAFDNIMNETGKRVKLVLIGSGNKDRVLSEIEQLSASKDIIPIGTVKDVYEYYCMSDVFILPSEFEGLPMALLEAMSCGLPSIASRVGGNPELITSGKNGFLIEPNNVKELTEAIMWCLDHQEALESIGKAAAVTIREQFSMEKVADEYINVYKKLVVK
jgi:glycosyltransferase involved in cell wall biosynthesis